MPTPSASDPSCRAYRAHALDLPAAARRACVQVVRIDFDWRVPLASPAFAVLSEAEHARALRFLRVEDAQRSAATRVALRDVLGAALGVAPAAVRLVVADAGRPALDPAHRA